MTKTEASRQQWYQQRASIDAKWIATACMLLGHRWYAYPDEIIVKLGEKARLAAHFGRLALGDVRLTEPPRGRPGGSGTVAYWDGGYEP